jgi:hypothetical protein
VSLDKLCQLWRQLLVKLFGSTGDPQRCGKGGTIILLIGFQRLCSSLTRDRVSSKIRCASSGINS